VSYVVDTSALEGGTRSTGAIMILRVRLRRSLAHNRISLFTRLSSAARQKGPEIRTPRSSSPLVELFLLSSFRFDAVARPALRL